MKPWISLTALLLLILTLLFLQALACQDSEKDDISPPGTTDDDDGPDTGEPNCSISNENLDSLEFIPTCYDPYGDGSIITITSVRGTSEEMNDGERYAIVGQFNLPEIASGKIEPIISCPGGSQYEKCSYPFTENSGAFDIRFEVSDCDYLDKPNQITINVWNAEKSENVAICQVYLGGEIPTDDDTNIDDDTTDDDAVDDDVATDDDATK